MNTNQREIQRKLRILRYAEETFWARVVLWAGSSLRVLFGLLIQRKKSSLDILNLPL